MRDLIDFKKARGVDKAAKPYLSIKSHNECDCKEEGVRVPSESTYSGNIDNGHNFHIDSGPDRCRQMAINHAGQQD